MYKRLTDKRKFFSIICAAGIALYVCYCLSMNYPECPVFRFRNGDYVKFTRTFLPNALSCIVFVLTITGFYWLLSHVLPEAVMKVRLQKHQ